MIYDLAIRFYSNVVKSVSPLHKKAKLMVDGQRQTFNILREKIDPNANYIWFHASSLGEFEQGRPLMEKIKKQYPQYKILLTFFSPSGYEVRKNYEGADVICYLPFDNKSDVRLFLDLARPAMAIFIKYEFWANYLNELKKRQIPTFIISAIFRREQLFFKGYGKKYLNLLFCFNHIFVQDDASKQLLNEFGVTDVTACGDTRFDRVIDVFNQAKQLPLVAKFAQSAKEQHQLTLVAGSSWPQDEEIFVKYFNAHPDMKLIIAPHEIHKEHIASIQSLLKRTSVLLSQATEESIAKADCIIVDSFGLLSSIYRYGDIAYIGGGFGSGIHNTLEAAVYGVPVIIGPKYQKFKEARDLIACGGAFSVTDAAGFDALMDTFRRDESFLANAGAASGTYVMSNKGATEVIAAELPL
ncbi:MAG: 3-deoxy-D-manno-octulosonic acid transferase [Tannerellaceae bacterium]